MTASRVDGRAAIVGAGRLMQLPTTIQDAALAVAAGPGAGEPGHVFTQQTALMLEVTLITNGIGLAYWAAVILPRRAGPGTFGKLR